jgi:predicted nucleic acid-binding protein
MTSALCIANSSPFIVFERIGHIELLHSLTNRLHIPSAVRQEVFGARELPDWVEEHSLTQPLASRITSTRLGAGESEAIAIALEMQANELILDDLAARRLAQSLEIPIIGSLGLLLRAKYRKLIPAVRPLMQAMQGDDFHISGDLFRGILKAADEI